MVAVSWPAAKPVHEVRVGDSITATPNTSQPADTRIDRELLVVGASYTAGLGASVPSHGYAYLLAHDLGGRWHATVAGDPGTGFLNPGRHHDGTYSQRIAQLPTTLSPGLVLIQAGRNDVGYSAIRERSAVTNTFELVRHRYPQATLVMLGAIPGQLPVAGALSQLESLFACTARADHIAFIDPLAEQWITDSNIHQFSGDIPGHPNDAGYSYIASKVAAQLRQVLAGAATVSAKDT